MAKADQYLGGEKLFPFSLLFKKATNSIFSYLKEEFSGRRIYYTFGAHSSLLAIIDRIQIGPTEVVLVPSYICPSVLRPLELRNVKYEFYTVNRNLKIEVDTIGLSQNVKAILFIDYMGKSKIDELRSFIISIQGQNIAIIQDAVQCVLIRKSDVYGDFVFNSFRKTSPLEGSYIIAKDPMKINYHWLPNWKFILNKRIGQVLRYFHLKTGIIKVETFINYFQKAESKYYDSRIYKMPSVNCFLIGRISFERMASSYRDLYSTLLIRYKDFVPECLKSADFFPLGFFMVLSRRDEALKELMSKSIFCPVHWTLPQEVSAESHSDSFRLAQHCLTIPFTHPLTMGSNEMVLAVESVVSKEIGQKIEI